MLQEISPLPSPKRLRAGRLPLSFDKLRMVSLVEPFAKEG